MAGSNGRPMRQDARTGALVESRFRNFLVGKAGCPPFLLYGDALVKVGGKQHRRVPGGDEVEAVGDRVVAAVVHDFLEAARGERGFGGDRLRHFADACGQRFRRGENAVHQAQPGRLGGVEIAPGVRQFIVVFRGESRCYNKVSPSGDDRIRPDSLACRAFHLSCVLLNGFGNLLALALPKGHWRFAS